MLAFTHIQKTAGTTLKHILRRSFGMRHCDALVWPGKPRGRILTETDLARTRWIYPKLESIAGHAIVPFGTLADACSEMRFYTFLREPLARAASHYVNSCTRGLNYPLEDFCEKGSGNNWQCQKLCGVPDAQQAMRVIRERIWFVGLVEKFDESLVLFRDACGESGLDIRYQSQNRTQNPSLKKSVLDDPAKRKLLEAANQEDLKLYRWVSQEAYPLQVRAYGAKLAEDVAKLREANQTYQPRTHWLGTFVRLGVYKTLLPWCSRGELPEEPASIPMTKAVIPLKKAA